MVDASPEFLVNLGRLFFVINPFVLIPIFHASNYLTGDINDDLPNVLKATIVALVVLVIFAFFGMGIIKIIGISTNSFTIAGGILLTILGVDMMLKGKPLPEDKEDENVDKKRKRAWLSPMGTPFIAGPGAITAATLMAQNETYNIFPTNTILVITSALFITMIFLALSGFFIKILNDKLGKENTVDFMEGLANIMGIIVTAIGVEFIVKGIFGFISIIK